MKTKRKKSKIKQLIAFLHSDTYKYILNFNKILISLVTIILIMTTFYYLNDTKNELIKIKTTGETSLIIVEHIDSDPIIIFNNYYNYKDGKVYIGVKINDNIVYTSIQNILTRTVITIFITGFIIIVMSMMFMYRVLTDERLSYLFSLHKKSTDLQHKIMYYTAYNLTHEVRTPLLIIKSVGDDLKYEISNIKKKIGVQNNMGVKKCNYCVNYDLDCVLTDFVNTSDELLELLNTSVTQIEDTLTSITDYKDIKTGTSERNLYDLFMVSINMLNRSTVDGKFSTVEVDEELKKYKVDTTIGMTDSFLLNTIINHTKNSLEARANTIKLKINNITDKHIELYVIDNGSGVSDDIKDHIMELHTTTKSLVDGERGTGLHTNDLLLRNLYDGEDNFVSSIPYKETIFCIKFRYLPV